jgi:hypothetical protein
VPSAPIITSGTKFAGTDCSPTSGTTKLVGIIKLTEGITLFWIIPKIGSGGTGTGILEAAPVCIGSLRDDVFLCGSVD